MKEGKGYRRDPEYYTGEGRGSGDRRHRSCNEQGFVFFPGH